MVFCLLICSGKKCESVTFLFFTCDLTFFLGEKATKACFLGQGRRPRLRKQPRLPFPPEKKSNHTRKTKKVTLLHFFPEQISKQNAFSYCLEVSYNHKVSKVFKSSV